MVMALEDATRHRVHPGSVRDLLSKSGEKSRTAGRFAGAFLEAVSELWRAAVWQSVSALGSPQPYPVGAYPLQAAARTQTVGLYDYRVEYFLQENHVLQHQLF
jgi:hypothetical protein